MFSVTEIFMSIKGLSNGEVVGANCSNCKIIAYNDEELFQKSKTEDGN